VLLFVPLVGPLVRICNAVIPRLKEEEKLTYLEPRLLSQPAIALEQAIKELGHMSNLSFEAISDAFSCMENFDPRLESKLEKREDDIDNLQADITEYLVKLSQHHLGEAESRMLGPLMHAVNDVERIGDHAENIFELAQLKNSKKLDFSGTAFFALDEMFGVVREQFRSVLAGIENRDTAPADKALKLEEIINKSDQELHDAHVERLEAGQCNAQAGVIFLDLVANLEKVGDHLTNIAERIRIVIDLANQQA
ncbi:MAG: Na/Pi cotransporter family protein, partial [Planctomycetes bacterium]|nr:Na/Pi cotransporter family protein [Planctomycetota bacterium]